MRYQNPVPGPVVPTPPTPVTPGPVPGSPPDPTPEPPRPERESPRKAYMASGPLQDGWRSEVARRVRLVARLVGLNERELEQVTGVGRATLGRIMRAERDARRDELVKIAAGTGVPERFLTEGVTDEQTVDWCMRVMGADFQPQKPPGTPLDQAKELFADAEAKVRLARELLDDLDASGVQRARERLERTGLRSGPAQRAPESPGPAAARPADARRRKRAKP
jgi:transcriptional regulator with XRE-family HTH domain